MKRESEIHQWKYLSFLLLALTLVGCNRVKPNELYHRFPDNQWARFNYLSFELPVKEVETTYDIILIATFSTSYPYETLDFNMVMKTSAGDERIKEYQMKVKSLGGAFLAPVTGDSCQLILPLKREFRISKPGILKIELENLIPRMSAEGIRGIGIRLVPSAKQE